MTRFLCLAGVRMAALLLTLTAVTFAADQRLLAMLPGNTDVVAGVNVRAVLDSGIGQELLRSAKTESADLNEFIAMTGLDPRTDVTEVLIAGFSPAPGKKATGADGKLKTDGVAFISGNFDPARIGAALASRGAKKLAYNGQQLWIPEPAKNKDGDVLTFLDNRTMIAGSADRVKQVLDKSAGVAQADIKSRANAVSGRYDIWMVSTVSPAKMAGGLPDSGAPGDAAGAMQGDILKKVESVQGGIKFGPTTGIGLEVISTTEQDAMALMNVLQFFQSMMGARSGGSGEGSQAGPQAAMQSMLSAVKMHTEAKTLLISMDVQEADVITFLRSAKQKAEEQGTKEAPGNEEIKVIQ